MASSMSPPETSYLPSKEARELKPWMLWALLCVATLTAHDFTSSQAKLTIAGAEASFWLTCDIDAIALGTSPSADSRELAKQLAALSAQEQAQCWQQVEDYLERRIRLRFDGEPVPLELLPNNHRANQDSFFGIRAEFRAVVPANWQAVTVFASRALPALDLQVICDGATLWGGIVPKGIESPAVAPGGGVLHVIRNYVVLGFLHIIPRGLDHILFVLGLFLLTPHIRPLISQVTAFTLAHTFSLALAVFGVVRLSDRWVETLIAASLVYIGVENLRVNKVKRRRLAFVFAFGLLHGMGFAGIILHGWTPKSEQVSGLLAFNVGVELGQLAVLFVAYLLTRQLIKNPVHMQRLKWSGSWVIAMAGATMLVTRLI